MQSRSHRVKQLGLLAIVVAAIATAIVYQRDVDSDPLFLDDVSRLNQTRVSEVLQPTTEEEIREAIVRAGEQGSKVSISGKKHSQGGHAFYHDTLHLDMTSFNRVLAFDEEQKVIRVQSGITWKQIQEFVNPFGLAVAVMQSSNIFTVGGSLSANVHGRDPRYGPVVETVRSFRLLTADGQIVQVSRVENAELFSLVIGGFGLFGVILDAELELTENRVYEKRTVLMDYSDYPDLIENQVKGRPDVGIHFGRLSIAPDTLLRDGYAVTYTETAQRPTGIFDLETERHISRDKFFFGLSREQDWGKNIRWYSQQNWVDVPGEVEIVARNNVMRPPIQFLDYSSSEDTDILQEYFVPASRFVEFIDILRQIVDEEHINLLSVTLRYVPASEEAVLSYAKSDCFAVVLYINQRLSSDGIQQAERWTQKIVDAAYQCSGTFYLVYQRYPTPKQVRLVYPRFAHFLERKRYYDPSELFMNRFYDHYAGSFAQEDTSQVVR